MAQRATFSDEQNAAAGSILKGSLCQAPLLSPIPAACLLRAHLATPDVPGTPCGWLWLSPKVAPDFYREAVLPIEKEFFYTKLCKSIKQNLPG